MAQEPAPHAVVLTSPSVGHVAPVAELAARLAAHHGFTVTIVTYGNLSSPTHTASVLASVPAAGISTTALPEVPVDDLPADAHVMTLIQTVVRRTLPHLRALLRSLLDSPAGVTVFLADMLCPAALAVAQELRYVFFTSSLMLLVWMLHTPELTKTITGEIGHLPDSEPVVFPGCVPLRGTDYVDTLHDSAKPVYAPTLQLCLDCLHADGYIVNTFDALEHDTLEAFMQLSEKGVYPPAYAVGPFVRSFSDKAAKHRCMRWLDEQPDGSVLYVCFGSGGTLSTVQTAEVAAGLEASGQRFLWVVRFPNDKESNGGYLGTTTDRGEDDDDPLSYLPEGFTGRTRGAGLVVPEWAPQVEVLGHRAVGGFLSHCGWNSALEAAAAGVPILAWPLFADQRMNAVKLASEHAGMALRVREREDDGVVPREEVAALARELMEGPRGAAARNRARELRAEALKASAPGGPAKQALAAVVGRWKCAESRSRPRPVEASSRQDTEED